MNKTTRTPQEQQALLEHLRSRYVYDAESGGIRHVKSEKALKLRRASSTRPYYDAYIKWKGRKVHVMLHRAVWAVCKGCWPVGVIDHIDNDTSNNHIENLRECSQSENDYNREYPWKPNAVTGVPGVAKQKRQYCTKIRGKRRTFLDPYEAYFWGFQHGKRYRAD